MNNPLYTDRSWNTVNDSEACADYPDLWKQGDSIAEEDRDQEHCDRFLATICPSEETLSIFC